jgi:hypothetical protein
MFQNRDSEMSKKRVSFASRETDEGNKKFVGIMKSPRDINPLTSFEHYSRRPISDPTQQYQDNQMLSSRDCRQSSSNQTFSSSEYFRLPGESSPEALRIRWYPFPSYNSSVASSKRLEWDNAADIGYARSTINENSAKRKSKKESDRFSIAVNKSSYSSSSKYKSSAKQQLSAKDANISERAQTSDLNKKCIRSGHTYIKTNIRKQDKSVRETLDYSKAKSTSVTENSYIKLVKKKYVSFFRCLCKT